jgi:hypothetical protein
MRSRNGGVDTPASRPIGPSRSNPPGGTVLPSVGAPGGQAPATRSSPQPAKPKKRPRYRRNVPSVREWPPITETELLERLAFDDEEFLAFIHNLAAAWGRREYRPELLERALAYPWERPGVSYLLQDSDVKLFRDLDPARRESIAKDFTQDRHPILSIGGNGAPEWLTTKFAHFPDREDRSALVLTGDLHGLDIGPAAELTALGYMPANLFASPGTAVRAALIWATAAQVTQLTWSEVSCSLGRLDETRFVVDETDFQIEEVFAYINRFGTFCIDGAPVALAAIPATGRTANALTQEELLDVVARLVIGADARAEDLVRAIFDDMADVTVRETETVWPSTQQLQVRWTSFPAAESR